MTRTIRDYQPTDGQEIEVLIVSRDESRDRLWQSRRRIGRIGRSGDGGQAVLLRRKLTTAQARLTR